MGQLLELRSRAPERTGGESWGGGHHQSTQGMAEALQASKIPQGVRHGMGRAGTRVRASGTLTASGWEGQTQPGRTQMSDGGEGAKPGEERVFKKRVMNSVQCHDNVKEDEGGNVSRIHGTTSEKQGRQGH